MITIYDEKYNITFWDIYKGEKTIRDVLDAAKKLYDMRSPTIYREDIIDTRGPGV